MNQHLSLHAMGRPRKAPVLKCRGRAGMIKLASYLQEVEAWVAYRVRTGLGRSDRPGSQGGLRNRGLWWK